MLNFTQEQLEAAKTAQSPDELIEIAKSMGIEITRQQAEGFLSPPIGELADEELENVAGGGCGGKKGWQDWVKEASALGYCCNHKCACYICGAIDMQSSSVFFREESTSDRIAPTGLFVSICVDNRCFNCGQETQYLKWSNGQPWQP